MRKMFPLLLILCIIGCSQPEPPQPGAYESPYGTILKGDHALRRLSVETETKGALSGTYFLLSGAVHGELSSETRLKFVWRMNNGMYAISSLPFEKVRVEIADSIASPSIRFRWVVADDGNGFHSADDVQYLMDRHVVYAVVRVSSSDWVQKIALDHP